MDILKKLLYQKRTTILRFFNLTCNLKCSYCINRFEENFNNKHISGDEWVGVKSNCTRADNPLPFREENQRHPEFFIINNIKDELSIDILTNLKFGVDRLLKR